MESNSIKPAKKQHFKLVIIWLAILALAIFAHALYPSDDLVSLTVLPEVPRKGEPVMVTFSLSNTRSEATPVTYDLFINHKKVKSGQELLYPFSTKKFSYSYYNDLELGQQVHFAVNSSSPQGSCDKIVSLPAYPPQVWSSFVSFASFSTSVMGTTMGMGSMGSMGSSMGSMVYYKESFIDNLGVQAGLIFSLVLISLLLFRETTAPVLSRNPLNILVPLRVRFKTVTMILLIIFLGMIFTRSVMILSF